MLRYFIISSFSHAILLGLLLFKNGIDDREKVESFYEKNMVVDMIPLIETTRMQGNFTSDALELHLGESSSFSAQTVYSTVDPTFTNIPQRFDRSPPKTKVAEDDIVINSQKNAATRPALPTHNRSPSKKIIPTKTPDPTETAFFEKTASKEVENTITTLPISKPMVRVDYRKNNEKGRESFEADNNPTHQFSTTSKSRDKNTATSEAKSNDILAFKREFIPEFDLSKNAKFSIDEMLKHKKSTNLLQSLKPEADVGITNHQCKLVPMQKKKTKINIRNIQNEIMSRRITITNILTNRRLQKSNEISISSLLASDTNTSSNNLRKQPNNIGFLMASHSLQYPAKNLVCEPN